MKLSLFLSLWLCTGSGPQALSRCSLDFKLIKIFHLPNHVILLNIIFLYRKHFKVEILSTDLSPQALQYLFLINIFFPFPKSHIIP